MKKIFFLLIMCFIFLLSCKQEDTFLEIKRETLDVADIDITNTTAIIRGNIEIIETTKGGEITKKGILWTTEKDNLHYSLVTGYLHYTSETWSGSCHLEQMQTDRIYYTENFNVVFSQTEEQSSFYCKITGLKPKTKYYVKAFAVVSSSNWSSHTYIVCGQQKEFTTLDSEIVGTSDFVKIGDLYIQTKDLGNSFVTWDRAYELCDCDVVGDYDDWRLPTYDELTTMYNRKSEIGGFAINNPQYWSGTRDNSYSSKYYFYINMSDGRMYSSNTGGHRVRCVRKDNDYVDLSIAGIAVQKYDISKSTDHNSGAILCSQSKTGGFNDWRLPELSELSVLHSYKDVIGGFERGSNYWSSTPYEGWGNDKWYYYNFGSSGYQGYTNATEQFCVRCVRNLN